DRELSRGRHSRRAPGTAAAGVAPGAVAAAAHVTAVAVIRSPRHRWCRRGPLHAPPRRHAGESAGDAVARVNHLAAELAPRETYWRAHGIYRGRGPRGASSAAKE